MEVVKKMMNREIPLLPDLYMPCCDVRIVALAHIRAMQMDEAQYQRHIVTTSSESVSFKEVALILQGEFKNYSVPTKVGPNFLMHLFSLFDKELRQVGSGWEWGRRDELKSIYF